MPSSDIAEQSEPPWVAAGLVSSFANLDSDEAAPLSQARACRSGNAPGCRAFRVPDDSDDGGDGGSGIKAPEVQIGERDSMPRCALRDLRNQVLVFQYRGKFHAIDHQCPHSAYPLSMGVPFDIEDFGVILSAGITCPQHGWSFDLFTGLSDRGGYELGIWDVKLEAACASALPGATDGAEIAVADRDQTVWVRRRRKGERRTGLER